MMPPEVGQYFSLLRTASTSHYSDLIRLSSSN
jgi:hypothetical protein